MLSSLFLYNFLAATPLGALEVGGGGGEWPSPSFQFKKKVNFLGGLEGGDTLPRNSQTIPGTISIFTLTRLVGSFPTDKTLATSYNRIVLMLIYFLTKSCMLLYTLKISKLIENNIFILERSIIQPSYCGLFQYFVQPVFVSTFCFRTFGAFIEPIFLTTKKPRDLKG